MALQDYITILPKAQIFPVIFTNDSFILPVFGLNCGSLSLSLLPPYIARVHIISIILYLVNFIY